MQRAGVGDVTALCNLIVSVCMCLGLQVIIKCLKPVRQRKIKREIKILQVQPARACVHVCAQGCVPACQAAVRSESALVDV